MRNRKEFWTGVVANFDPEYHGDYPGQLGWRSGVYLGNIKRKKNAIRSKCNFTKQERNAINHYDYLCKFYK